MKTALKKIAVCSGEPAGIGPDIVIRAAQLGFDAGMVVIGDPEVIKARAEKIGIPLEIVDYPSRPADAVHIPGRLPIMPVQTAAPVIPGKLNVKNSRYVIRCIDKAVDLCTSGECHAMVTAPVHKGIINDAGIPFSGHTEWIARRSGAERPVMMLANGSTRVCLATTHLPLREVPEHITGDRIQSVLAVMARDIARLYGIGNPRIGVCGLNPHAGEGGHLGKEEIAIIEPAIAEMQQQGLDLVGPLPADTAFTRSQLSRFDGVLAMYHDQGLPVIKHSGFGEVVNITLGLPIIRTSVDHGTALDRAGRSDAEASSLIAAIRLAVDFANNRAG